MPSGDIQDVAGDIQDVAGGGEVVAALARRG
jgi:hypothetical protein